MKILVDTNVVLDIVLNRQEFLSDSKAVFELAEEKHIIGCISAFAITDIFYFAKKHIQDIELVYQIIEKLNVLFQTAPVTDTTVSSALALRWKDFEDAVQFITAKENDADFIITRNKGDFKTSDISCMTPTEFIVYFKKKSDIF